MQREVGCEEVRRHRSVADTAQAVDSPVLTPPALIMLVLPYYC